MIIGSTKKLLKTNLKRALDTACQPAYIVGIMRYISVKLGRETEQKELYVYEDFSFGKTCGR